MIFLAVAGPTPGSDSNCDCDAVFRSTLALSPGPCFPDFFDFAVVVEEESPDVPVVSDVLRLRLFDFVEVVSCWVFEA